MDYDKLTFNDDSLGRKIFVENIMNVIEGWNQFKHENSSLSISLDASWGSGKSYLLNMWKNWLISEENKEKNYGVVYYNAWENDDCENAFIPLVYEIQNINFYKENDELFKKFETKSKVFLKSCAIALLKDGIKKFIGEETADLIGSVIDDVAKEKVSDFFGKYKEYLDEKENFKQALLDLTPEEGKLIIFIDELDRCRPTFAVETLEIIKHYFNIPNIVFIFAIDIEQLSHSISTMYGQNMDSASYLRRFFDFNVNIPSCDIIDYVTIILRPYFYEMDYLINFIDVPSNVFLKLGLSLRDINKVLNNFILFCLYYNKSIFNNIEPNNTLILLEVYLYFMTLKYKYINIYNLIIKQEFMMEGNSPKRWKELEGKYYVSTNIFNMLSDIQTGNAHIKDKTYIRKYCLNNINSNDLSFAEHIERTIEMFK